MSLILEDLIKNLLKDSFKYLFQEFQENQLSLVWNKMNLSIWLHLSIRMRFWKIKWKKIAEILKLCSLFMKDMSRKGCL